MYRFRSLRTIAALCALAVLVGACGGGGSAQPSGSAATSARPTLDTSSPLVLVSWGGSYADAINTAFAKPFTKATGVPVNVTSVPDVAQIKRMVDTGTVDWDVIEVTSFQYAQLVKLNLLEPIDYSTFDKADLDATPKEMVAKFGYGFEVFSYAIAYRTDKFPNGGPKTWADVWNVGKFPGPRSLRSAKTEGLPDLESALLADGVPMDKLYPLDIERAFKSLDKIKKDVVVWFDNSTQSADLIQRGESFINELQTGRTLGLKDKGVPVEVEYNEGKLKIEYFVVPKGARNKAAAMEFIRLASQPEQQAAMSKAQPTGPANSRALALLDEKTIARLPTSKDNLKKQYFFQDAWWLETYPGTNRTNQEVVVERWYEWVAKK